MRIPLGDFLRAHPKTPKWLKAILAWTKGVSINVKGAEIALDQKPGGNVVVPLERPHRPGGLGR